MKYVAQLRTITKLNLWNGWGISRNYFFSPVIVTAWIKDGLINEKGELTSKGRQYQ